MSEGGRGGGFQLCLHVIFSILMVGYNGRHLLSNHHNKWLGREGKQRGIIIGGLSKGKGVCIQSK